MILFTTEYRGQKINDGGDIKLGVAQRVCAELVQFF